MVVLNEKHYIGEGLIRTCYVNPEDKNQCIKVPKPHVERNYTYKEILYYLKLHKRDRSAYDYSFYSDYKGEITTNLGVGQIFDLIRDEPTGTVSKTLEYYLGNESLIDGETLWEALLKLKAQMTFFKVFTRDLRARNLCCKLLNNNTIQIIIIDGIGHRDFFPLADYFNHFSKKKIERTFKKWHFTSIKDQKVFLLEELLKTNG